MEDGHLLIDCPATPVHYTVVMPIIIPNEQTKMMDNLCPVQATAAAEHLFTNESDLSSNEVSAAHCTADVISHSIICQLDIITNKSSNTSHTFIIDRASNQMLDVSLPHQTSIP